MGDEQPELTLPAGARPDLKPLCAAIAHLHAERYGRGPRRCRGYWAGPDAILILLENGLTQAEHLLVENGHGEGVITRRRAMERILEPTLRDLVEEATGRRPLTMLEASDLAGNEATPFTVSFTVEGGVGETGDPDTTGGGNDEDNDDDDDDGDDDGATTGDEDSDGGSNATGDDGGDEGCSCTAGPTDSNAAFLLFGIAGLAMSRRRKSA